MTMTDEAGTAVATAPESEPGRSNAPQPTAPDTTSAAEEADFSAAIERHRTGGGGTATQRPRGPDGKFAKAEAEASPADEPAKEPGTQAEPTEAKSEDAKPTPEAQPSGLDSHHVRLAKQVGYTEEDIAGMDPETWNSVIERSAAQLSRRFNTLPKGPAAAETPAAPAPDTKPTPAPKESAAAKSEDAQNQADIVFEPHEDAEEWTEKLNALVARMAKPSADPSIMREITSLREQVQGLLSERKAAESKVRDDMADKFFAGMAEDFPQYGDQPTNAYAADHEAAVLRVKVTNAAKSIMGVADKRGEPMSYEDALALAFNLAHVSDRIKQAKQEERKRFEERRKGAVPPPSSRSRSGSPRTNDEKFSKTLDSVTDRMGLPRIPDE
jgi:predicted RNA-binding Zn ribbon-like protein